MTVSELIEELQKHSGGLRVVIRGYEDGVDDIERLRIVKLKLDTNKKEWYYGRHSTTEDNDSYDEFGIYLTTK